MKKYILVLMIIVLPPTLFAQSNFPDLSKKEDLQALGKGKIYETDNTSTKNIEIFEIKEFWIVYIKNDSLHDLLIEKIDRIEFPDSKWGSVVITFIKNKPVFKFY